jgi:hypothetical protein
LLQPCHMPSGYLQSHRLTLMICSVTLCLLPLAAACGGASPASHRIGPPLSTDRAGVTSTAGAPSDSPGALAVAAGYCGVTDSRIPGASLLSGTGEPAPGKLSTIQQAWFGINATVVPACSEMINDAVPVDAKNLTDGQLSDAAFQRWIALDTNLWTVWEWAGRKGQWGLERFLYPPGNPAIAFVESGGTITDDGLSCEYPSKVYAIKVDAADMNHLTGGRVDQAGVGYALAWKGPCRTIWTSATGQTTTYSIAAGDEGRELEITQESRSTPLGDFLLGVASIDAGDDPVATALLSESGV